MMDSRLNTTRTWLWAAIAVMALPAATLRASDDLANQATWSLVVADEVRQQVEDYLADQTLDAGQQAEIDPLWPPEWQPAEGIDLLDRVAATLAVVDPQARELVLMCQEPRDWLIEPELAVLYDEAQPEFVRNNLRLLYGRWLAQQRLYDEASHALEGLVPEDVVDPASLLFYQGAAYHFLMEKDAGLAVLGRLLERQEEIPRRYGELARLMEADLKPLEVDTLDEIARLMNDIERRLDLGRAGTRVRQEQDDVLAKLDQMIEELEKQRDQSGGSGGTLYPSNPMQDSQNARGLGPGNVDPRHLAEEYDWGNLPPKDREEALQQMTEDFPAHYREVIEEYFRRLARDQGDR